MPIRHLQEYLFCRLFTLPRMAEIEVVAVVVDNSSGICKTAFVGDVILRAVILSIVDEPKVPGIIASSRSRTSITQRRG